MNNKSIQYFSSLSLSLLIVMIAVLISLLGAYEQGLNITNGFIYALITICVAFTPILLRVFQNELNVFEPIVLSMVMLGILFGIRPIAMYFAGETEYFLWYPISPYLDQAVFLGMIGTVMFLIGYLGISEIYSNKSNNKLNRILIADRKSTGMYLYCFSIFLLSLIMFYLYISASGSALSVLQMMYSGRSQELVDSLPLQSEYFSVAPILSACAAVILIVSNGDKKFSFLDSVLIAFFVLFPVVIFLLMGVRRFIIPSVFIPLVVYYLVRNKKPRLKNLFILAPLIFLLLSVVPYLRTEGARTNLQESNSGLIEHVFTNAGKHVGRFILGHDTEMVSALSVEIGALKTAKDYYYGRAVFGDLLLAPIPSIIFPEKPTTARDGMLVDSFGMKCNATEGGLCPDFSVIGTFYQDFWYVGVSLGMLIIGSISALMWQKYLLKKASSLSIVVLSCWVVFLPIIIRAGFMPAFAWFLYFLMPSLIGLWISKKISNNKLVNS